MKKYLKRIFNILRRVDAKVIALLSPETVFRPQNLRATDIKLDNQLIKNYDKASFENYFCDPKTATLITIYMRARNGIFIRMYRLAKRIVK